MLLLTLTLACTPKSEPATDSGSTLTDGGATIDGGASGDSGTTGDSGATGDGGTDPGEPCKGDRDIADQAALDAFLAEECGTLSGALTVQGTDDVTVLDLPQLRSVAGSVTVEGNSLLEAIRTPVLSDIGGDLVLGGAGTDLSNPQLATVSMASLRELSGSLSVVGTPQLADLDLQRLFSVAGSASIMGTALTKPTLPALDTVGGSLVIQGNDSLIALGLGVLGTVGGDLQIRSNPKLPTCDAVALSEQLAAAGGVGGSVSIAGNLTDKCSR